MLRPYWPNAGIHQCARTRPGHTSSPDSSSATGHVRCRASPVVLRCDRRPPRLRPGRHPGIGAGAGREPSSEFSRLWRLRACLTPTFSSHQRTNSCGCKMPVCFCAAAAESINAGLELFPWPGRLTFASHHATNSCCWAIKTSIASSSFSHWRNAAAVAIICFSAACSSRIAPCRAIQKTPLKCTSGNPRKPSSCGA
jgi:hypothetical protein